MSNEVYVFGAFPPPTNGSAVVNAAVSDAFEEAGLEVRRLNTAPSTPRRGIAYHATRLLRVLGCFGAFAMAAPRKGATLYVGINAGAGLIYDVIIALLARFKGMPIVAHYHSFAYIDDDSRYMRTVQRVLPRDTQHIFLCGCMGERFMERYGAGLKVLEMPSCLYADDQPVRLRRDTGPLILGHLSNLSRDKGLDLCIDTLAEARERGLDVRLKLAGPCTDPKDKAFLRDAMARFGPAIEWAGPLYGADKSAFFRSIDVFLFPTKYKVEADPIVVAEAMAAGAPVIALARGCIADVVTPDCGTVIQEPNAFAMRAADEITNWLAYPGWLAALGTAAQARHHALKHRSQSALNLLIADLGGRTAEADMPISAHALPARRRAAAS